MSERLKPGREPVQIVEIDQDFCTLTYGTAPCTASLGLTGTRKCFNTRKTCQDPANYNPDTITLRFCRPGSNMPPTALAIPTVTGITTSPTRLNVGAGDRGATALGRRASVTVSFDDAPYSDLLTDKYRTERTYDPLKRGTFWSKFLARNPYYQGRELRIIEGYYKDEPGTGVNPLEMVWESDTMTWATAALSWGPFIDTVLDDQRTRTYIIERITGPDASGRVAVVAKDILKLADDRRATAPKVSQGVLTAALAAGTTSTFAVTGAILSEYTAGGGTVRIGDECITYSGASESGGIVTFTITARGTDGTTAADHAQGDQVQECYRVTTMTPYEAIEELLVDYADVDPAFIDSAAWAAENNFWLVGFELTTLITQPTGVQALIGEICEQVGVSVWWDERDQEIRFQAVRPPLGVIPSINGDNILADTLSSATRDDERITQTWVYINQRLPTERLEEPSNFRQIRIRADLDAESSDQYGDQRIRRIFARWLQTEGQAADVSTRVLSNYRDIPQILSFELDAKDSDLWTGDILDITFRTVTDDTGFAQPQIYQIISAQEQIPGHSYRYEAITYRFASFRVGRWTPPDDSADPTPAPPDYDSADDATRLANGYWANADGLIPDGADLDPGYDWI